MTTPVTSAETWAGSSPPLSTPWLTNCAPYERDLSAGYGQGGARAGAGSGIGAPVFTRSGRGAAARAGRGAGGPRYGPRRSGGTLAGGAVGVDAVCCDSPRTHTWSAAGEGLAAVVCGRDGSRADSGGGAASGRDRVGRRRGVPGCGRLRGAVRAGAQGCAVPSRARRLRLSAVNPISDLISMIVHATMSCGRR